MKNLIITTLILWAASPDTQAEDTAAQPVLTVAELNHRAVIGKLGVPLGKVVELQGAVVREQNNGRKGQGEGYLLRISHVGNKPLEAIRQLRFSVPKFAQPNLAANPQMLYELRNGRKAPPLSRPEIEALEAGYLGQPVRLVAYEVGRFFGIPAQLPEDVPVWAEVGFHFSTSLVVLAERSQD